MRLGYPRYYTGKPCKYGHISERWTRSAACVECVETERKRNPEAYLERMRSWAARNRKRSSEIKKKWSEKNPEARRAITMNYISRKRGAEGKYTARDISRMLENQKHKCANCLVKLNEYHVDHIVPLSCGGTNWPSNLQVLCPSCNTSKGSKDPIKWAQEQGRLI